MERIAIISDIHGNLEALKTVLEDIQARGISRIFCLGDIIAKGVHMHECVALVKKHCEVIIQGNCEEFFSKDYPEQEMTERIRFNQNLLTKEDRTFLRQLPFSYDFYLSGSLIRLVHATPWSNHSFIGAASSLKEECQMFLPTKQTNPDVADIVIYGHTHTPYVNKAFHRTLINAGSVGNALEVFQDEAHPGRIEETCKACYLILEGNYQEQNDGPLSYTYVRLPYDIQKELNNDIANPEKESYAKELTTGAYRDISKLKLKIK